MTPPPQLEPELPPAPEPASPAAPATADAGPGSGPAAAEEIRQVQAEIHQDTAERAPEVGPAAAAGGATDDELLLEAERMEARVQEHLTELTREDVADVLGLVFSLIAVKRGPHWRMEPATEESRRISMWVEKAVQRHGVAWIGKWLPDLMAAGCLVYAVRRRLDKDLELAGARPPEASPPQGAKHETSTDPRVP